jgi:hypothetical protein
MTYLKFNITDDEARIIEAQMQALVDEGRSTDEAGDTDDDPRWLHTQSVAQTVLFKLQYPWDVVQAPRH